MSYFSLLTDYLDVSYEDYTLCVNLINQIVLYSGVTASVGSIAHNGMVQTFSM